MSDPAAFDTKSSITDWDELEVQRFFTHLGYPQYDTQIREHGIRGDILSFIGPDDLKEFGIATVGQRLAILRAVYYLKVAHNVPIEPDHYVPPSEVEGRDNLTVDRLYDMIREQDERLRGLELENRRLSETMYTAMDDISTWRTSAQSAANGSPTKPVMVDSPTPSPQRPEHPINNNASSSSMPSSSRLNGSGVALSSNAQAPQQPRPARQESSDNLRTQSFKVSLEDPAWKVLPAALRKYKINNDDWQNYAMFICYGPPNNRIERCLSYDEKPLLLFQKLKDASKNPVFMLKHIKDIRSPIAVAQQKQAARKASAADASASGKPRVNHGRTLSRPPKLQVQASADAQIAPPLNTAGSAATGWPDIMSPAAEHKDDPMDKSARSGTNEAPKSAIPLTALTANSTSEQSEGNGSAREVPVSSDLSYAVAIYPYMAEQEDEFDVVVGDTFTIISRARGWWVVQRDPAGAGVVDSDASKQGWVPAGCLLETRIPVAKAIEQANATHGSSPPASPIASGATRMPILPLHIISTSFPGYALMDYKKKGDEELDLAKDDALRVFKRYNHWSYAVKEDGGDRGWVPSWYIGKIASSAQTPATPAQPSANTTSASIGVDDSSTAMPPPQVSPMSSAFPPQARGSTFI
ncbi:hypothetical protein K488DRAFT_81113 [Vararia minispora EC-137]|uniref:Uncharacterized protein n=1 Tax=Vararia minispora EC-137 TaxID=1314806 RepID=A0ACB8Q721_9AGAM|nr:hypothetical protein K488DRAFT_81113 [Vararia minispora EC-137]